MGRLLLIAAAALILCGVTVPPASGEPASGQPASGQPGASKPRLHGSFVQFTEADRARTPDEWGQLFHYFRELALQQLVLQWTVLDGTAFFSTQQFPTVERPPLETFLQLADDAGMHVLIGLAYDTTYWESVHADPSSVDRYLQDLRQRSIKAARAVAGEAVRHSSFEGWYLPEEVDDVNWREPAARRVLYDHLRKTAAALHEITPTARIALSGFSNARMDPQAYFSFWSALLEDARDVNIVLFQDGIGTGKLTLSEAPLYFDAIHRATASHGDELRVVVELFRQTGGPPLGDGEFKALPAPLERIQRQMDVAAKFSDCSVGFSVPDYLTPWGGRDAMRLFDAYLLDTTSPTAHR